jgi:hypothetical protein
MNLYYVLFLFCFAYSQKFLSQINNTTVSCYYGASDSLSTCLEGMNGSLANTCYVDKNISTAVYCDININTNNTYVLSSWNSGNYKLTLTQDFKFTISKICNFSYLQVYIF